MSDVDAPSLVTVLCFTVNLVVGLFDRMEVPVPSEAGLVLVVVGSLFFAYVLVYLRRGFFGNTKPVLAVLITDGPYRLCRHPQYVSFICLVIGFDLMFRSPIGIAFTCVLTIPSAVYRAKREDALLRERFGAEWTRYAETVGFMLPKFRTRPP